VARYGSDHKRETRQRIIDSAGRRLKRDGIDGSGIATLMADAGLTNGAFYAHFSSKDDLIATTVAAQLQAQRDSYAEQVAEGAGVEQIVRQYLSAEHRDNAAEGCPSAALVDEIGRCDQATKLAFTDGTLAIVDDLARHLAPTDPASVRGTVTSMFALMIGALQLARAVADSDTSDEILEQGVRGVLKLWDDSGTDAQR
jgi:TetR/AcrR family transcriptional regulator, transcriptional repressor for nem operon